MTRAILWLPLLAACAHAPAVSSDPYAIPPEVAARMQERSLRAGCPVPLEGLAYLEVPYVGFDGASHRGPVIVARELADEVRDIFAELHAARFPIEKIRLVDDYGGDDDRSMADDNTSAFNCRPNVTRPGEWSKHSFGRAIDINPLINPYVRTATPAVVRPLGGAPYLDRTRAVPGLIVEGDACHRAFTRRGWAWGGGWRDRQDYQHFEKPEPPIGAEVRRLIVVRTQGWDAIAGELVRFERASAQAPWVAVPAPPVAVVVGRGGLGWGIGLHGVGAPSSVVGPVKKEGDGRAAAGVFRIDQAYGYDAAPPAGTALPYARLTESWRCVDDTAHPRYNQVFDAAGLTADWTSEEIMRRKDDLYRWVIEVDHNSGPTVAGAGSCIFLHVWRAPTSPTSGCTAMAATDIEALLPFLAPGATALVQLPAETYAALAALWQLP